MVIEINSQNSSVQQAGNNPDRYAMLQAYQALEAEFQQLKADLSGNPSRVLADLQAILRDADKINAAAHGNILITPTIGVLIGSIQDAIVLAKDQDWTGIEDILTGSSSEFQGSLTAILQFILHDASAPQPSLGPNFPDMMVQIGLLEKYLSEFQNAIESKNYNEADRIMGYLMTAVGDLYADANENPAITPLIGQLVANVYDMRTLLLSSPPDYQGCLDLLKDGSIQNNIQSVLSWVLAQTYHSQK